MNSTAQLTILTSKLKQAGIDLPAPGQTSAIAEITAPTRAEILAAVVAAHAEGKDPLSEPTVQRLTTAHVLAGLTISEALARNATDQQVNAIYANRGHYLSELREAFNQHAETLTDQAAKLGNIPLQPGTALGHTSSGDFNAAYAADQAIERIREAWGILQRAEGQHRNPLSICAPSLQQWDSSRLTKNSTRTAWELIHLGITLDLAANVEELDHREQRIKQQAGDIDAERHEAYKASNRAAYRHVAP